MEEQTTNVQIPMQTLTEDEELPCFSGSLKTSTVALKSWNSNQTNSASRQIAAAGENHAETNESDCCCAATVKPCIIDLNFEQFVRDGKHMTNSDMFEFELENSASMLYEMSCSNVLCDAVIMLEHARFTVHKIILCTCSLYFQAAFTGGFKLKHEIFIPDICEEIMRELLKYAYLRRISLTPENVCEVLIKADYLGFTGLKKVCNDFLIRNLTPEDCVSVMIFARNYLLKDLYERARSYLLCNFSQVIKESTADILKLEMNEFYGILKNDNLNIRDESLVWQICVKWLENDLKNRRIYIPHLLSTVRLGLLTGKSFIEDIKNHALILQCEAAKPLIIEAFKYLYDLNTYDYKQLIIPTFALPRFPHEVIFAIGGLMGSSTTGSIETYNTRSERWSILPHDPTSIQRAYHGTAVIGYKIYFIGGTDYQRYFSMCHVFDVEHHVWTEIAPLHCRRCYVSVTLLDGYIYAIGGCDGRQRLSSAERYDPLKNQWSYIASLQSVRSDGGCCTLNHKIYMIGGYNGHKTLDTVEVYDPKTNEWALLPKMSMGRSGLSCVGFHGCIYVIGGTTGRKALDCVERYDPINNIWTTICKMNRARSNFGLQIIDDMIFVAGGYNGVSKISHTEYYRYETNEWIISNRMNNVRSSFTLSKISGLPEQLKFFYIERNRLPVISKQQQQEEEAQQQKQISKPIRSDFNGIARELLFFSRASMNQTGSAVNMQENGSEPEID